MRLSKLINLCALISWSLVAWGADDDGTLPFGDGSLPFAMEGSVSDTLTLKSKGSVPLAMVFTESASANQVSCPSGMDRYNGSGTIGYDANTYNIRAVCYSDTGDSRYRIVVGTDLSGNNIILDGYLADNSGVETYVGEVKESFDTVTSGLSFVLSAGE